MALPNRSIQSQIARGIAFVFVIGGLMNKFSGHEWAPLRSTDLYSQVPASKTYRAYIGAVCYVLPVHEGLWQNGDPIDAVPGIQVPKWDTGVALIQSIRDMGGGSIQKTSHDDSTILSLQEKLEAHHLTLKDELQTKWLSVVIKVNETKLSWWDYATSTKPRVIIEAYESWPKLATTVDRQVWEALKPEDSHYQESIIYWMLMSVPVLFLALDMRPFGASYKSAREALFRPFSSPLALLFKRYLADVFFEWVTLDGANKFYNIPGCNAIVLLLITLVDTWLLTRRLHNQFAMAVSCGIKLVGIVGVTLYVHQYEQKLRYATAHLVIEAQWTLGNLVAQVLALYYGPEYYETLEATFHKLAVSLHLYTASCTKMGEAGLAWIDDRYIAQLALRGQYGGDFTGGIKYPLADMLLYQPALLRASGMVVVLIMELTAVFSWWDYGSFLRIWMTFMAVSTMTIGVPLAPHAFGPLEGLLRYITVWGVLAVVIACILALSYVKINTSKGTNGWKDIQFTMFGGQKEKK